MAEWSNAENSVIIGYVMIMSVFKMVMYVQLFSELVTKSVMLLFLLNLITVLVLRF